MQTVYDLPEVSGPHAKCNALRTRLNELIAEELGEPASPVPHNSLEAEALALLTGTPAPVAEAKRNWIRERAVLEAAIGMAQRDATSAILAESRQECERRRPEHCELLADIFRAVEALKLAIDNEENFRGELRQGGFDVLLPGVWGSAQAAFGGLLRRLDLDTFRHRLTAFGVEI